MSGKDKHMHICTLSDSGSPNTPSQAPREKMK